MKNFPQEFTELFLCLFKMMIERESERQKGVNSTNLCVSV